MPSFGEANGTKTPCHSRKSAADVLMERKRIQMDRDKLRAEVRKLGNECTCLDDVIFFAYEGGSWQVGVDWAKVLPVWFKILSATAEPEEYAERITALLSCHYDYGRDKMLAIARRTATTHQRKALAEVEDA